VTIRMQPEAAVWLLRRRLLQKCWSLEQHAHLTNDLRLHCNARRMADVDTLSSHGIGIGGGPYIVRALEAVGGSAFTVTVHRLGYDAQASPIAVLRADSGTTFYELKWRLWAAASRRSVNKYRPSQVWPWAGIKDTGDGHKTGTCMEGHALISNWLSGDEGATFEITLRPPRKPKDAVRESRYLSRMQCVKQLFLAFANRCQAYNYATEIGLVTFGSDVQTPCPITPHFEAFKEHVQDVKATGDTKLYDALQAAAEHLVAFKTQHAETRLRILCLTDGQDSEKNGSTVEAHAVTRLLQQRQIMLDAVCIGDVGVDDIKAVAKATNGYCFNPKRLRDALKLNELETLLTHFQRPEAQLTQYQPLVNSAASLRPFRNRPLDICDDDTVPPRRVTAGLALPVHSLRAAIADAPVAPSTECKKEVVAQLKAMHRTPHAACDIFPSETDLTFWKVIMEGPGGSPYADGTWLLSVRFPPTYPVQPPEVRFVTSIIHCNINSYGKVCHSILDRNWTSDTTMHDVFSCIYGLLLTPDKSDPLDSTLALSAYNDDGGYEASIFAHVGRHASKTRAAWLEELNGE